MQTLATTVTVAAALSIAAVVTQLTIGPPVENTLGPLLRTATVVAWTVVAITWHSERQRRELCRRHKQLLRKVGEISCRVDSIDNRVQELSADRTQAAAAVVSLFGTRDRQRN